MAIVCRCVLMLSLLLVEQARLLGATGAETRAFRAATELFSTGFYDQAEPAFAAFIRAYPASAFLPEAVLYQAEARIQATNYPGAIELLSAHQAAAGTNADEYAFWLAEARFRQGDYHAASEGFGRLVQGFPTSSRRLEALLGEATACARLSEWPRALELLQATNGLFQTALQQQATNELVLRGCLLVGEARLTQGQVSGAEEALRPLAQIPLEPQLDWQRQHLLCRIQLARGQIPEAMQGATNLLRLANAASQPELYAEGLAFQASLFERLGQLEAAIAAYTNNLVETAPAAAQRDALSKAAGLLLAQNRIGQATELLEGFLSNHPTSPAADAALLTLGELYLRQHAAAETNLVANAGATNAPPLTNALPKALTAFLTFTNRFPQSPLYGKAQLDLGWCYWLNTNLHESEAAFQSAVKHLPLSADKAVACFKLADTQYLQTNYDGAISNYKALLSGFSTLPEARTNLFEPALYQVFRAALAAGKRADGTNALTTLLNWYPNGSYAARAVLLNAQDFTHQTPAEARAILAEFLKAVPGTEFTAEAELAIAHTYEQENQWPEAIKLYDGWLAVHTNHPAQGRVEYYAAQANSAINRLTNALARFTHLVTHFPTNEFAPLAQLWLADYHFSSGDFKTAEAEYQAVYQNTNFPSSPELAYGARMSAGRAALAREGWGDAKDYFTWLAANTNCPDELRAQAFFAIGDYWMSRDSTNKLDDYQQAFASYDFVCKRWPASTNAVLAWGAKASCLLQSAKLSTDYLSVSNAFQQVITNNLADARARSIAWCGLGVTLKKMAETDPGPARQPLLNEALDCYLKVLFPDSLLREGETPDWFWCKEAGLEAAQLAMTLQQWEPAIKVYERLKKLFPPLASQFDDKIEKIRIQRNQVRDRS